MEIRKILKNSFTYLTLIGMLSGCNINKSVENKDSLSNRVLIALKTQDGFKLPGDADLCTKRDLKYCLNRGWYIESTEHLANGRKIYFLDRIERYDYK